MAQANLGNVYLEGKLVPRDDAEAAKWMRKAADQGYANAQFNLARMYETGRGVDRSEKEATALYAKAAEIGLPAAQLNLGVAYASGRGVAKDPVEAYRWFNLAAASASDDATRENAERNRDLVAVGLSREELARAQAISREWKPSTTSSVK